MHDNLMEPYSKLKKNVFMQWHPVIPVSKKIQQLLKIFPLVCSVATGQDPKLAAV